MKPWLLYGAYGYTGRLIAREAVERGMRPVLAGRNPEATRTEAQALGLEHRAFALDDPAAVRSGLADMHLVLNAAGPFSATFGPVARACLDVDCHYLDITGEVEVFEAALRMDAWAREAGVVVLPGVGFEVVPSDSLAARVAGQVERPVRLTLAYAGQGRPTRGTARTVLEGAGAGALVRREGRWVQVTPGSLRRSIPFADGIRTCTALPLGDLSTGPRTTGIDTVDTLVAVPGRMAAAAMAPLARLVALPPVRRMARAVVDRWVQGPAPEARDRGWVRIWCEVAGADGEGAVGEVRTPDAYSFTAIGAAAAVERILNGRLRETGASTPARALGPEFAESLPGVQRIR